MNPYRLSYQEPDTLLLSKAGKDILMIPVAVIDEIKFIEHRVIMGSVLFSKKRKSRKNRDQRSKHINLGNSWNCSICTYPIFRREPWMKSRKPSVMKKIVIDKAGSYDQLKIQEFPDPKPGRGEVLIETRAMGINFADCCVRMGVYRSAKEFIGWPITPGFEVSGVIKEVGEGVTRFKPGQNVIAVTFFGGYCSHVIAGEELVFPLPFQLSFEEGASLPAVFLTAYYALFELVHPHQGDTILVHSAAGGVGSMLVQLGKQAGCTVVGVVGGEHKVEAVKCMGADFVIDKSHYPLWEEAARYSSNGYDVILDANGIETLSESYKHLSVGGKLVVYGFHTMFSKGRGTPNWLKMGWDYLRTPRFNPLNMTNDNHSVLAFNLSYLFSKVAFLNRALSEMLKAIEEKRLFVPRTTRYAFEDVAQAHRDLESGQTVGKLVLVT